jgi:threonylcarbamoyladenosine tRNA methylthiotransferase MtaB
MPVFKIVTLGCKVNQYESQYVREGFARLGYLEDGEDDDEAAPVDLILVNTCTVTAESEAKGRKLIRRLAKRHPQAEIVVLGCYAARAGEEAAKLPGVSEVVGDKRELPEFLKRRGLEFVPDGISHFEGRHRAWVKVQDGCRQHCSYCIVPLVRPHLSSRPVVKVLEEITRLTQPGTGRRSSREGEAPAEPSAAKVCSLAIAARQEPRPPGDGFAEIVLTGIHLGHYGVKQPEPRIDLAGLVEQIVALPGGFRIRLSSIEAAEVTPELLGLMAERPDRICPHLHLPLQSGSDAILERMKRPLSVRRFLERCDEIHSRLDRPALTTDVIVGFPGETEDDFAATCRAVEQAGFSKVHVFRFSPRQGTPAAALPNRVPQRVHHEWAERLNQLSDQLRAKYLESLVGGRVQVLVESMHGSADACVQARTLLEGTADRYVTVEFAGPAEWEGRLIDVCVERASDQRVMASAHSSIL